MTTENTQLTKSLEKSLTVKSLKDLVRVRTSESAVLLLDVSGSMGTFMRNGKTRINGLRIAVSDIQSKRPTSMIAFGLEASRQVDPLEPMMVGGTEIAFVTEVPDAQGGTPLAEAIDFARTNGFGRAVVISDGVPNDQSKAMDAARQFGGQIDVLFVGDPGEAGSFFLDGLAKATGGSRFEGDLSEPKEIAGAIVGLLNGEVLEQPDADDDEEDEDGEEEEDDEEDDDEEDEEDGNGN